jgi:GT2 family glycosyltransferase
MEPHITTVVVDNASHDATVEIARRGGALVIANAENRGFAAAVNQGIRAAIAESAPGHFLLLNPDARILTALDELVTASTHFGLAAGRLVNEDGETQAGFTIRRFPTPATLIFELAGLNRLFPWNPVNRRYRYLDRDLRHPGPVDQPAGAFLMTRRDLWERLGGFDERFHPIWFEDVDYSKRAAIQGHPAQYVPSVTAAHDGAHSIAQVPTGCRAIWWCVSLMQYAAKHFGAVGYRAVCLAVLVTSIPRAVAGMMTERSLAPASTYSKIIRFAAKRLVSLRTGAVLRSAV